MERKYLWFVWLLVVSFCISIVNDKYAGKSKVFALDVGGIISNNTTFTIADSPVNVNFSVIVNEGVTLTIEPGVELRFAENTIMQINGELIARGTVSQSVVFTLNPNDTGNWGQILFTSTANGATFDGNGNYLSGSILEFCTVEKSGTIGASISSQSTALFIANCTIQDNSSTGINYSQTDNSATVPELRIINNIIARNIGGISIFNDDNGSGVAKVNISDNTISLNSNGGFFGDIGGVTISKVQNIIISDNTKQQ